MSASIPKMIPLCPKPPPCRVIKESIDFLFLPRLLKAVFNALFKSKKNIDDYPTFGSDL